MKLHNNNENVNIITDYDVTMTNNGGKSLHEVLTDHNSKISKLESNVKWMYRYGALGSGGTGGSGGGSGTSKIKLLIFKDGLQPVSPGTKLIYPGEGSYTFKVELHGGGSDSFLIKYYYNPTKPPISSLVSKDNEFTTENILKLEGNGELTITVTNQSTHELVEINGETSLVYPYITAAYNITANYVYADTHEEYHYNNNLIFMDDVAPRGLMLALNYNIAVKLQDSSTKIEYVDWENRTITVDNTGMHIRPINGTPTDVSLDLIETPGVGILYLPLADNIYDFLSDEQNAAFKQVTIIVTAQLADETQPSEFIRFNFFDNLIPSGLFLNIRTNAGKLYVNAEAAATADTSNQIVIGDIGFKVTPYNGSLDTSRPYQLRTYVYNVGEEDELIWSNGPISLIDQRETDIILAVSSAGVKKIVFELTLVSTNETKTYSYYILTRTFPSSFKWYPDITVKEDGHTVQKELTPYYAATYRRNEDVIRLSSSELSISGTNNIQVTSNDSPRTINLDYTGYSNIQAKAYDILFALGLQYSSINNTNIPILSLNVSGSTDNKKKQYSIFLYQDKIAITTSDTNILSYDNISLSAQNIVIYLPLEDDYKPADTSKYHLFNIYKRFENNININYYRSISSYIDGVLEGLLGSFSTNDVIYDSITLYPGNYTINLIEYSMFNHTAETTSKLWLEDIDINRYFKSYNEKIIHKGNVYTDKDAMLFSFFNKFEIDEANRIVVDYDDITNISKNVSCPVMLLTFTDNGATTISTELNVDNFMNWFEHSYKETDNIASNIPVTVMYSDGKGTGLKEITLPDGGTAMFAVDIQGSSTKEYRCKNLELYAPSADEDYNYIYTPNLCKDPNDPEYASSFLPEGSFTLKADVVDSSHTNNNAIGKFVNDNTTPFAQARYNENQPESKYKNNIKNTLIGFPILLFLHTIYDRYVYDENNQPHKVSPPVSTYYFLGIYNFNLGRKSYYNLGFKNISNIEPLIDAEGAPDSGFAIYKIGDSADVQIDNIVGAEIQGNNPFFDFSQYSTTNTKLLFDSKFGMWGDYVGNKDLQLIQTDLANLCRDVAFAGGFVFTEIGKKMEPYPYSADDPVYDAQQNMYGYAKLYSKMTTENVDGNEKIVEWVPNYHYQASVKQQEGSTIEYEFKYVPYDGQYIDLINLINTYDDETTGETNTARIDYVSVAEYYTVMMAMGLVDSPMKNLNMRSWNDGKTFYAAFYDMDTGLGKSNAGTYINYFAFSDFWRSSWRKIDNTNVGELKQVNIIRDYAPESFSAEETSSSFFDVPSNYLFAVVKYAKTILRSMEGGDHYSFVTLNDPSNIWGKWRTNVGCLRNAKYFMDTYFNHHLATIPEEAFNFNYRYKYLPKNQYNTAFDSLNFMKFHGRGNAYTEHWLDGRLHILDAYFNVTGIDDTIAIVDNREIKAPYTDVANYIAGMGRNEDVYILQDAFSGTSVSLTYPSSSSGWITVEAKQYAPTIVSYPMRQERYLFPSNGEPSRIFINFTGSVGVLFGGSKLWTSISSIVPFITLSNTFTIYSKYITTLIGTSGVCTSWGWGSSDAVTTPSLRTLILTAAGYSGDIKFESSEVEPTYQNLDEIVISNTAINLSLKNVPVRKLYATNMQQGAEISATGCDRLEDVQISGEFNNLQLSSWGNDISLPTSGGNLLCTNITITNNTSRFPEATLRISNNNKLTTLNITGFAHLYVTNCPNLSKINFGDNTENIHPVIKTLDIQMPRYDSEGTFTIGANENEVDLKNFENLETLRLTNTNISYVILPDRINAETEREIKLLPQAFSNCRNFVNFRNEDGNKLYITGEGTFYNCGSQGTEINGVIKKYNYLQYDSGTVMTNIWVDESCTSLKDTFNYSDNKGPITFEIASEFLLSRCENVNNVTNIENMFKNNNINYGHKTGATEYLNETCSLSIGMFTECNNAHDIFTGNAVEFFNRYMFIFNDKTFAENHSLLSLNTMSNEFCYTTIDVLYPLLEKITAIDLRQQKNLMIYKPISGWGGQFNTYETLVINNMFSGDYNGEHISAKRLTSISNFTISPTYVNSNGTGTQKFDFTGLFDNDKTDESEYNWIGANTNGLRLNNFMNATYSVVNYDISSVNTLFSVIVPTYIMNSFGGFSTLDENLSLLDTYINIYTMFDWDKVRTRTTNLFVDTGANGNVSYGGLNCIKRCTYNEFQTIWTKLVRSSILIGISSIFTDCKLYKSYDNTERWNSNEIFELTTSETVNESITFIPRLFTNLELIQDNYDFPLNIDSTLFKNLKNIVNVYNIFGNVYMKHAIPFNLFNKRKKKDKEKMCYINKNNLYVDARLVEYEYNNTIDNMADAFLNVTFEDKFAATFTYTNNDYNIIERNYVYTQNDDTHYDEYYLYEYSTETHQYEYIRYDVEQPTEVQDIDNLVNGVYTSTYSAEVTDYSTNRRTYKNLSNFNPNGFVVSPDIFRCCSEGCNISNALKCDNRTRSNNYDPVTMTGMLPPSLFGVNYLRKINFTGTLYGLNVTPICMTIKDQRYDYNDTVVVRADNNDDTITRDLPRRNICYQFVWDNFTERENLSNCFNFMLLLPSTSSEYDTNNVETLRTAERFYMFSDISFTKDVLRLADTLPIDCNHIILEDMDSDHLHNYYISNNEIHFNIMGYIETRTNPATGEQTTGLFDGIDPSKYKSLMFDSLINADIAKIYSGYVISSNTVWNRGYLSEGANVFFQVGGNNTGWIGVSCNAQILAVFENFGMFPRVGSNYNINKASLALGTHFLEEPNLDLYWQGYHFVNLKILF